MNGQADFFRVVLDFSREMPDTTRWGAQPLHPRVGPSLHENEAIGATVQHTVQYINIIFLSF
jgi:hypothetical protein